jgi:hypothetical protein
MVVHIVFHYEITTLAVDRGRWLALVNALMNFSGAIECGKFLDQLRTLT